MNAQHRVVGLDARRRDLRARPHRERDLRLLAVVDGETLEEQAAETGASTAAAGVENPSGVIFFDFSLEFALYQSRYLFLVLITHFQTPISYRHI